MIAGITEKEQKIIEGILDKYRKDYVFFYYGSRVKGTYEKTSDLDILVKGKAEMPSAVLQGIKEEFDNSDLPYIVNFSDYYKLDGSFYKRIKPDLIPYNWQEVKLGDVCDVRDGTHDSPKQAENGKYLITSKHIKGGKIDLSSAYKISIKDFDAVNQRSKVDQWDILISMIGTVGEICLVSKEPDFAIKNVGLIKTHSKDLAKYLYYYLKSPKAQSDISSRLRGTTQQYLSLAEIRNFPVVLPPLDVQKKIAGVLGALDDKIELNNKINQNLEAQAQVLFKSWFIDFEPFGGKMPNDWKIGKVDDIVDLYDSQRIPLSNNQRSKMKKIYPYYGATSVMDFVEEYIFDGKYLLLGEDGTVIDNKGFPILQYVWGKFWVNNHAHIMTGKNGFTVESLYLFFKQTNVKEIVTGAVQPKINQSNLKALKVRIPTHIVMNEFNQITAPLFSLFRRNTEENFRLAELRDTLLPKLMNGEIDVDNVKID